jgi:hypothetical protein
MIAVYLTKYISDKLSLAPKILLHKWLKVNPKKSEECSVDAQEVLDKFDSNFSFESGLESKRHTDKDERNCKC